MILRALLLAVRLAWAAAIAVVVVRAIAATIRSDRRPRPVDYPNEWGVRTHPLTPAEAAAALEDERAIARRLGELAGTASVDELAAAAVGSLESIEAGTRHANPAPPSLDGLRGLRR